MCRIYKVLVIEEDENAKEIAISALPAVAKNAAFIAALRYLVMQFRKLDVNVQQ